MRFAIPLAAGLAAVGFAAILASCSSMGSMSSMFASGNDPNLYLEEIEGERALAWARTENARSLAILEGDARYAQLHADALALANSHDRLPLGAVRDGYYYNFWQDETHVRGIWRRSPIAAYASGNPAWETILDVDALASAENKNWVYKGADCLSGTTRCMLELSDGGRDAAVYREFDTATKAFVQGGFEVPDAKSNIGWQDRDTLLVGTDWGAGSMTESGYPYIVKAWRRGTPLSSATEVIRGVATDVSMSPFDLEDVDGSRVVMASQATTFFESVYFRLGQGAPQRLNLPPKSTIRGLHKGFLLFTLEQEWNGFPNGALLAYPVADMTSATPHVTQLYAPSARESIDDVVTTRDAVLIAGYQNVRGRILRYAWDGRAWIESTVALPPNGAVNLAGSSPTEAAAFATFEDFLTPTTLYALEDRATRARSIRSLPAQFNAAPYTSEQFEATSRDGTKIPYFVVRRRDQQANGQNPTLLYAYGGFQVSELPFYSPSLGKLWLDRGGTYVLANIRGGGEFGPAWHQAGLKTHRQVIYDDFYAVEQDLVARHITSPRRLGIEGGSNGGLLMGVMLNQHPEMVHAAVVQVPLIDMLRYDQLGAGASWVDEYGSPHVPAERRWLERMSPYQNLRARPDFPMPFIETSTRDDRVHPGHARKYAARMAELGIPFLYYENIEGGHAAAANLNETARRRALEYTYLMRQLMD